MKKKLILFLVPLVFTSCEVLNPFELNSRFEVVNESRFLFTGDSVKFKNNSFPGYSSTWDFGDGTIMEFDNSLDTVVYHTYSIPGVYNVSLTVNNNLNSNTTHQELVINELVLKYREDCDDISFFNTEYKRPDGYSNKWGVINYDTSNVLICPNPIDNAPSQYDNVTSCSIEFDISLMGYGYIDFWFNTTGYPPHYNEIPECIVDGNTSILVRSDGSFYSSEWIKVGNQYWIEPGEHKIQLKWSDTHESVLFDNLRIYEVR